jgi:hypothetical protein
MLVTQGRDIYHLGARAHAKPKRWRNAPLCDVARSTVLTAQADDS